ncbi:MAG: acyltransferase, partial [Akkermansiaceae bacterium]|nr:acyltransferase [Verrucomicrobiales bacterium]
MFKEAIPREIQVSRDRLPPVAPRHFYSLDALRGLAALAVVFWHWPNFSCYELELFHPERQPFYSVFKLFYTDGARAVNLFFCLSGFIFFWLYAQAISERAISLKKFAVLRISRLYPLHLLTLLFVLVAQQVMVVHHGSPFAYTYNDSFHFGLQLFMASNWGFERGYSFNGPIWSVSVEMLLYAAFFYACRFHVHRLRYLWLFVCVGALMRCFGLPSRDVGCGVLFFFLGGISFRAFNRLQQRNLSRSALSGLGVLTSLLWLWAPIWAGLGRPAFFGLDA